MIVKCDYCGHEVKSNTGNITPARGAKCVKCKKGVMCEQNVR